MSVMREDSHTYNTTVSVKDAEGKTTPAASVCLSIQTDASMSLTVRILNKAAAAQNYAEVAADIGQCAVAAIQAAEKAGLPIRLPSA